jgi:hypothetical protein
MSIADITNLSMFFVDDYTETNTVEVKEEAKEAAPL